jgi:hypothetical protein
MHPTLMLMWMDAKRADRERSYRTQKQSAPRERSRVRDDERR